MQFRSFLLLSALLAFATALPTPNSDTDELPVALEPTITVRTVNNPAAVLVACTPESEEKDCGPKAKARCVKYGGVLGFFTGKHGCVLNEGGRDNLCGGDGQPKLCIKGLECLPKGVTGWFSQSHCESPVAKEVAKQKKRDAKQQGDKEVDQAKDQASASVKAAKDAAAKDVEKAGEQVSATSEDD